MRNIILANVFLLILGYTFYPFDENKEVYESQQPIVKTAIHKKNLVFTRLGSKKEKTHSLKDNIKESLKKLLKNKNGSKQSRVISTLKSALESDELSQEEKNKLIQETIKEFEDQDYVS
jgi:Tfp pilus assembly protein PilO